MNRRQFLASSSAATVATSIGVTAPAVVTEPNRFERTDDGRIVCSDGRGSRWQVVADFGPDLDVVNVADRGSSFVATIRHRRHNRLSFQLTSRDGLYWKTVGS